MMEHVPKVWQAIGFSGRFSVESDLGEPGKPLTPEQVDEFESKLPDRVPFGSNSGWLALRVNREVSPPTVVLVRRDTDAVTEALVRPQGEKEGRPWQTKTIWYLATCLECRPVLPQPFRNEDERNDWATQHRTTGHNVVLSEEAR